MEVEAAGGFRAGYLQFSPVFGDISGNLEKVVRALTGVSADLIVLPELPFTGYGFTDREELLAMAREPEESPVVARLVELCRGGGMHMVTGFAERAGDRCYNSSLLLGPSGIVARYRKLHLFDREKLYFDEGDLPLSVHPIPGARLGMMVCFDWIFPEVARTLALMGADILCHPANLVLDHCQRAMVTRCTENMVFSVTANRTGTERRPFGNIRFTGRSRIAAPEGEVVHTAEEEGEEVFVAELDINRARDKRITPRNHVLRDRRPDLYFE